MRAAAENCEQDATSWCCSRRKLSYTLPSAGRQLRLRRARFDSHGYQVDGLLRPRVEGAG
eukprot:scaffold24074_cov65-Phaeocystis_antarctica.AAC.2